jgi:hypothetical protein
MSGIRTGSDRAVLEERLTKLEADIKELNEEQRILLADEFWRVFFRTIYWEHELVPNGGVEGPFLPGGGFELEEEAEPDGGEFDTDADDEIIQDGDYPAQALGAALDELALDFAEPAAQAEEPDPELEIGEEIPADDPRLHTPRAQSYRELGCKKFVEPKGAIFGNEDNGYVGYFLITAKGRHVIIVDTDEPDNAAYLFYAAVEGDADETAWVADATKTKMAVRKSRRFVRRFFHVLSWITNIRRWLANH